jgi:acyl-CoA thioester hydrolase
MDALAIVNNVAIVRVFEEGRVRFFRASSGWDGVSALVARHEFEYRSVLEYGTEPVQVRVWVSKIGGSSHELSYALSAPDGPVAALGASTLVSIDQDGKPTPIPDQARHWLKKHSGPSSEFRGR